VEKPFAPFWIKPLPLPQTPINPFIHLKTTTMQLTAYNVKTKEKNVPIQDAVITRTSKGGYMAQGNDGKGNKLTSLLSEAKALAAIQAGTAKQGW
jgi:hypothetical protein